MPIGIYGTVPHVLTNKNLGNKKTALKEVSKEAVKGTGKLFLANGAIMGAGAGTTYVVNKFFPKAAQAIKTKLSVLSTTIGNALSKVVVNGGANLKELIKGTGIVEAVKSLPAPVKGAIAAGAVIFPFVANYIFDKTRGNMAAAEAKQETKQV